MRGLEFRGKVNRIKDPGAVVFSCVLGGGHLTLVYNGSGINLIACSPPEAQRWNCLWSPGVKVGHTFSSWNNSFLQVLIAKPISYYLKLKVF